MTKVVDKLSFFGHNIVAELLITINLAEKVASLQEVSIGEHVEK